MALSLFTLRLSDKQKLRQQLENGNRTEFLSALRPFLSKDVADSGADEAFVYATAVELTSIGVWDYVKSDAISDIMSKAPVRTQHAFVRGLPPEVKDGLKASAGETVKLAKRTRQTVRVGMLNDDNVVMQVPKVKWFGGYGQTKHVDPQRAAARIMRIRKVKTRTSPKGVKRQVAKKPT
ncbi:hypothetical protein [Devosia sp. FKR38]|uniref:hypothetical protein n=1 Tax=Devosia sp. FKR38 TaxID=2562312 RepID=UPI0010BF93AD|nr:hypothetical protein [Devosia sp. FKR38]